VRRRKLLSVSPLSIEMHSYKQQNFNLLREESEGYAKLVTELISNLGPAHDPATALPTESYASSLSLQRAFR
jgi:THO complex subunit 2